MKNNNKKRIHNNKFIMQRQGKRRADESFSRESWPKTTCNKFLIAR